MSQTPQDQPHGERREGDRPEGAPPPSWPATPPGGEEPTRQVPQDPTRPVPRTSGRPTPEELARQSRYPYAPQTWGPVEPPVQAQQAPQPQPEPAQPQPQPAQPPYGSPAQPGGYPPGSAVQGYGPGTGGYGPPPGYGTGYAGGYAGGSAGPGYRTATPEQASTRTQAILALVLNIVSVLLCGNIFGIVGAVLSGIALGKIDADLPQARTLLRWGWILLAGGLALTVLAVLGIFFLAGIVPLIATSGDAGF
jgi:hypothetical protein